MSDPPASPGSDLVESTSPERAPRHAERLSVPWWWWPPAAVVAVLLAAEIHMGHPGVRSWLPYLLLIPLTAAVLVWLGWVRVDVGPRPGGGEPELRAGRAHLPLRWVGRVDVATGDAKRRALGPDLDPEAHVLHRPWVTPVVRLEVLDPDDPAPYWVVSTRHPDRLLAALGSPERSGEEEVRPRSRGR